MKNSSKIKIISLLMLIFFSACSNYEPNIIDNNEMNLSRVIEIDDSKIVENQCFDVDLNDWGNVRFVSCKNNVGENSTKDVTFYLQKDGETIYQFPEVFDDNDRYWGYVDDISFVSFQDIDNDLKKEVIVGVRVLYDTGFDNISKQASSEIRIYSDKGDFFKYKKEISSKISNLVPKEASMQDVLDNYIHASIYEDNLEELYNNRTPVEDINDFEGEWHATNIHTGYEGDMTITNQTKRGFHFRGTAYYFFHVGDAEGDAYFVNDDLAIYNDSTTEKGGFIEFYLDGERLYIRTVGDLEYMGSNVSLDNEYTKDAPLYTNENALSETYNDDELALIKKYMDEVIYNDYFIWSTETGYVYVEDKYLDDETKCKYVYTYTPTDSSESYIAIITEDGLFYIKINTVNPENQFYTNDKAYTEKSLPKVHSRDDY